MTWTQLPDGQDPRWASLADVAEALTQLSQTINAAFQGRSSVLAPGFGALTDARYSFFTDSLTVAFEDASTAVGGTITAWLWDFGDGGSSTSQNPSHTYAVGGAYLVGLRVTSSTGQQVQSFHVVEVAEPELQNVDPVASFTSSINSRTVTFTDTSTDADGTVVDWEWGFGDSNPTAGFSSIVTGLSVAFTDTSTDVGSGTIAARLWSFGDGSTSTATNPTHVYAAAGGYNVTLTVTDNENNQGSASATVQVTTGATLGLPFGPYALWASESAMQPNATSFGLSLNFSESTTIVAHIAAARAAGQKLILSMTACCVAEYATNGNFTLSKWKLRQDRFDTNAIKAAIAAGVLDGTVLGAKLIDEPEHSKHGTTMSKSMVDQMATYTKAMFPTLKVGVSHGPAGYRWRTNETFAVLDWVHYQYNWSVTGAGFAQGDATGWRGACLAQAALDGVSPAFSINLLDGGFRIGDCVTGFCPEPQTGGLGTFGNTAACPDCPCTVMNCRMTAAQVEAYGLILGPAGCGFLMWRYDSAFMAKAANKTAFANIAADLATRPTKSWGRIG